MITFRCCNLSDGYSSNSETDVLQILGGIVMNLKWKGGQIVLAVILGMVVSLSAHAQTSNGTIVGSVTDPAGAVVLGATVTVTNTDLGAFKRTTKTDSVGSYRIDGLLPGNYSVSIQASGMQEFVEVGVAVKASLASTVNASLIIGSLNQSVSVEASTGAELQTQSGELSSNLGQTELKDLPILGSIRSNSHLPWPVSRSKP